MKKMAVIGLLIFIGLTSFGVHKFYMSIYQMQYSAEKKRLEITSRIFIDDINKALQLKYSQTTHIGETGETTEDIALMNKYLLEHFTVKINGVQKQLMYVDKELDHNVVVGYYKINDVGKITSIAIRNTVLTDVFSDQQNIIQTIFNGKKQSLLLTAENSSGTLK